MYRLIQWAALGVFTLATAAAQKHELGLTMGRLSGSARTSPAGSLELGSGVAFQAEYAYSLHRTARTEWQAAAWFLANPLRDITSANSAATRDVATIYAVPAIKLRLAPNARFSPFGIVGGGYALYEQSFFTGAGESNSAPRFTHRGAFLAGGGLDYKVRRWLAFRGDVRHVYSGSPAFNLPAAGGQRNLVVSGGFVLRWGVNE